MTGECLVVAVPDGVRVDQADPKVRISLDLLASWRAHPTEFADVTDHELVIRAVNGQFRYEVGDWVAELDRAELDEMTLDVSRVVLGRWVMGHRVEPPVEQRPEQERQS